MRRSESKKEEKIREINSRISNQKDTAFEELLLHVKKSKQENLKSEKRINFIEQKTTENENRFLNLEAKMTEKFSMFKTEFVELLNDRDREMNAKFKNIGVKFNEVGGQCKDLHNDVTKWRKYFN